MNEHSNKNSIPRLRILISAHELSPIQGSECSEGWNLVTRLAKYHDVTVLYAGGSQFRPGSYRRAVKEWSEGSRYSSGQAPGEESKHQPHFIAIPQPGFTLNLARLNKRLSRRETGIGIRPLYFWGYNIWQRVAFQTAKKLHQQAPFDLVHHLTQITFREPGYLWKLGIPFVWGPTGGLQNVPKQFARDRGLRVRMLEAGRKNINKMTCKINPRIKNAINASSLIYAFSRYDQNIFQARGAKQVELMLDAGSQLSEHRGQSSELRKDDRFSIIWVGQIIERKALDILIEAIRGSEELIKHTRVTIVGGGPLMNQCKRRISRLSHFQQYDWTFTGQLPHNEVATLMQKADVLVHTSYREASSNVIPEALSVGLPVICHDVSGMSIAIDETCGIKIPLESYEKSVQGFRNALLRFTEYREPNTEYRANLKKGALTRAQTLSWDSMAKQIAENYSKLVG